MGRAVVTGRRYTASGSSRQGTPLPPCLLVLFLFGGAKAQGAPNTTARLPSRRRLQPEYYGGGLVIISRFFQFELGSARVTVHGSLPETLHDASKTTKKPTAILAEHWVTGIASECGAVHSGSAQRHGGGLGDLKIALRGGGGGG